ncbi:hypothetical protein DFH09DRAFT_1200178 [Mycena vulgaris]|nr:hypothetical protein DFH09DRAFT_1200178 [Mycena vulgaris]
MHGNIGGVTQRGGRPHRVRPTRGVTAAAAASLATPTPLLPGYATQRDGSCAYAARPRPPATRLAARAQSPRAHVLQKRPAPTMVGTLVHPPILKQSARGWRWNALPIPGYAGSGPVAPTSPWGRPHGTRSPPLAASRPRGAHTRIRPRSRSRCSPEEPSPAQRVRKRGVVLGVLRVFCVCAMRRRARRKR